MTEQLLDFIQNHWMLSLAGLFVLTLIILEETKNKVGGALKISAQKATLLINKETTVVLDLRNQKKFSEGHILNSINIEHSNIENKFKKLEAYRDKDIVLVADNEKNTATVAAKLNKKGFTKLYILSNGIAGWENAQLPLDKS